MGFPKTAGILVLAWSATLAAAEDVCSYRPTTPAPPGPAQPLVSRADWLAVEHLRVGLDAPHRYLPGTAMRSLAKPAGLATSPSPIDPDRLTAVDPDDGAEKPLRALLDTRLYADGIVVVQAEEILLEHYRAGFSPESPRLLLQASRPILTAMLAAAAASGKLPREQSLARALPELARQANLRKTSVQRLLDDRTGLIWPAEDRRQWLAATGWEPGPAVPAPADIRTWLKGRARWPRNAEPPPPEIGGPEGELLVWVLENTTRQAVSRRFCESVLADIGAEHEAFWASTPTGTGLADGLALSLRDFARFGTAIIRARTNSGTGKVVPSWFAASLAAAEARPDAAPAPLRGLGNDIGWKYRFARLGQEHRAMIVGPYGNSLLIDFDHKLVVALFASVPKDYSALALASLRSLWSALERHLAEQPEPTPKTIPQESAE